MSVQVARIAAAGATSQWAGIDLTSAGLAAADLADLPGALAGAASLLAGTPPAVAGAAAAVPDEWLAPGIGGAARRESVRKVLGDDGELPLAAIVGHSHAVVARHFCGSSVKSADASAVVLVCGLAGRGPAGGVMTVALSRCEIAGGAVRLRRRHAMQVPPAGAASCGEALAALARERGPGPGREAAADGVPEPDAVRQLYGELASRRRRLSIALAAARGNAAYRDTPVAGLPGSPPGEWVTAGEVQDHFAPLGAALADAVAGLLADGPLPAGASLLLTGDEAANPLAQDLLVGEIERRAAGGLGAVAVLPGQAAAEGAALIASGAAAADLPVIAGVRLPLHRISGGRLLAETIPVPATGHCGVLPVSRDGTPVTVAVPGPEAGAVWVETAWPDGPATTEVINERAPLRAGDYRVGLWPDAEGGGVLVLRPVTAGEPVLFPLPSGGRDRVAGTAG